MEKLLYTIGEVADEMKVSVSLVRYWSNTFPRFVKPQRNAKGNRFYTARDIDALKQIQYLVKVRGMTLDGAAAELSRDRSSVDRTVKVLESLKEMRSQLVEIRKTL